jgi:hypothetical protein
MKTLSIFIAGLFAVLSVSAQSNNERQNNNNVRRSNNGRQYNNNASIVTVSLNGNTNEQVLIDGRNYGSGNNGNPGYKHTFQITNLQPGQHTLQINNKNGKKGILGGIFGNRNNNATAFNLRNGYDTQIAVNGNGRVQIRETRSIAYQNNRNNRDNRNNRYNRDNTDPNYNR